MMFCIHALLIIQVYVFYYFLLQLFVLMILSFKKAVPAEKH